MSTLSHQVPRAAFFRATSLGAVRGLQLTRVPWLDRLGFQASHYITAMLRPFTSGILSHVDTYSMVTNALYIGNSPSHSDDLRLFVVFPHLKEDVRNNSRLLACFWQRCMLPAIDAIHSPDLSGQPPDGMDYMTYDARDDVKDLDESLATFSLHTPIQRRDSMQLCLEQAWESIERTVTSSSDLQALSGLFLIVSWEAPAVALGPWQSPSFEQFLEPGYIDQTCGKVVYEQMQEERPKERPVLKSDMRMLSRKRSATLTQLEDRADAKRKQSMDMT